MKFSGTMTKKIALYFVFIIVILIAVVLYTINSIVNTNLQYEYLISYLIEHAVYQENFHQRFNDIREDTERTRMVSLTINFLAFALTLFATFIVAFLITKLFIFKEEELTRLEYETTQRSHIILDGAPVACYLFDMDFNAIYCNQEVLKLFDIDTKEQGMEMFGLVFFLTNPLLMMEHINDALKKGMHSFEWEIASLPCQINFIRLQHNNDVVMAAYIFDLSTFYNMLEEKNRVTVAEENSRTKSQFLARTSHEIRTPITAVLGIAEIQLQNPEITIAVEEAFAKIYNSSQILLGIINDILDLSKIEAGKMNVLKEKYESASLINDIVQLNVFRVGSKKIKFNINIDENIPVWLVGDELRIKQILNNLLSNAFKYTDYGSVNLTIKSRLSSKGIWLTFVVNDTGHGMTKDQVDNLFHEYVRFNEKENRYIEGAGLGMSIVHNLIQLMDADISVESEVGEGTTFTVTIPQSIGGDEVLGKDLVENLKNFQLNGLSFAKRMKFTPEPMPYGNVLVVDDVDTNLYVAKGILSFYDLNIDTCDSGYEAVRLIEKGNVYDIIFMDHMMPGMDGIETVSAIRKKGYTHPIVSLTANAVIGQAELFLKNGFDGFISKPIDTSHLNAILNKFIRDKQPIEVVETARKNSVYFNPNEAKKLEMWNFFSDPAGSSVHSKFAQNLRIEFSRTQKNVIQYIEDDISSGAISAARRRSHTLKGLAYTIGETELAVAAGNLESLLEIERVDDETTRQIKLVSDQLNIVINKIVKNLQPVEKEHFDYDNLKLTDEFFENLKTALQEDSTQSLTFIEELRNVPEAAVLVIQVENFDYESALKTLEVLREIL